MVIIISLNAMSLKAWVLMLPWPEECDDATYIAQAAVSKNWIVECDLEITPSLFLNCVAKNEVDEKGGRGETELSLA